MKTCIPNIPTIKKKGRRRVGAGYSSGEGGRLFEVKACGVGAYSGEDSYKIVCA